MSEENGVGVAVENEYELGGDEPAEREVEVVGIVGVDVELPPAPEPTGFVGEVKGWDAVLPPKNGVQDTMQRLGECFYPELSLGVADLPLDEFEIRARAIKNLTRNIKEEEFIQVEYDLPDCLSDECPNPSGRITMEDENGLEWTFPGMWRFGYRRTGSCWCLRKEQYEHPMMKKLLAHWKRLRKIHGPRVRRLGQKFRIEEIPYDKSANELVYQRCLEELDGELRRLHTSLIETIAAADERLAAAQKKLDEEEAAGKEVSAKKRKKLDDNRDSTVRGRINWIIKCIKEALHSAELYDQNENLSDLVAGLRAAIKAQAEAFNLTAEKKGIKKAPTTF